VLVFDDQGDLDEMFVMFPKERFVALRTAKIPTAFHLQKSALAVYQYSMANLMSRYSCESHLSAVLQQQQKQQGLPLLFRLQSDLIQLLHRE